MPKKAKKQNLSINTGEPIEEKDLELNPIIAGEERMAKTKRTKILMKTTT